MPSSDTTADITQGVANRLSLDPVATTATAGVPGTWGPAATGGAAGALPPADAAGATAAGAVATPGTNWTSGQYMQGSLAGSAGWMNWNGTAWVAGKHA